jgi:hypothetical protein
MADITNGEGYVGKHCNHFRHGLRVPVPFEVTEYVSIIRNGIDEGKCQLSSLLV